MATGRLASWASCGALAAWLLAGCGGGLAQAPKPAVAPVAKPAAVTDVQVSGSGDDVQITVVMSAKASYSLVRQTTPPRLFLQLTDTRIAGQEKVIPVHRGVVTVVKASSSGSDASLEVFLSAEALYDVEGQGASIVLNVTPKPLAAAAAVETTASPEAGSQEPPPPTVPTVVVPSPVVVTTIAVETPAAVAPAAEAAPPPEVAVSSGPRALTAIEVKKQDDGLVVTLQGNGPLKHDYFLVEGRSLVVDIAGANNKVSPLKKKVDDPWVSQIRIGEHEQPKKFIRVVFDLKKVGEHRVESVGDRIVVAFGAPALGAAGAGSGSAAGVQESSTIALNTVGAVTCRQLDAVTRLEISTAVKPDFMIIDSGDPTKIIVEIANARISEKDAKALDLAAKNLDVVKVTAFPYAKGDARLVRVVAQLRRPVPFRASAEDGRVVVDFEKSAAPVAASQIPVPVAASVAAPATVPAPVAVAAGSPVAPAGAVAMQVSETSGFAGRRLSLDFKDAEVNDILRLISEVSGLNFVSGPEVKGTVSIKLADVPWDQALDLILKTNVPQLAQIRESDNIIRITTSDKIMDEEQRRRRLEEDKKKTVDAQKALEPLFSKSFAISYIDSAKLQEFVGKLEKFKSAQGNVQFDERTKNIIVQDTAQKLKEIEAVILSWDAPTPAVMVEARIVQVSSGFEQQLGVQWNAAGVKDAAHGNATDYAFPNSMSVDGTQTGTDGNTYMVNLPAAAATSGVGFSFGHIANTLSLDLRLSAMETLGQTKVLSNPKVLVVQNQKAIINVGNQLPVTKTDSQGNRTVEWKDVGIMLEVTPQVTNDKRIFLDVRVEKSSQGVDVQTTDGTMFSIDTSRAQTKVLIADGETTVIGGIFVQSNSTSDSGVPWLSKLPVLGWLFKSTSDKQSKQELMIFLTPRLIVM